MGGTLPAAPGPAARCTSGRPAGGTGRQRRVGSLPPVGGGVTAWPGGCGGYRPRSTWPSSVAAGPVPLVLAALARHGLPGLRIAVVDPVRKRGQDRTWAFWGTPGGDLEPMLSASWSRVEVTTPAVARVLDLTPLRYAMLRSAPLYARAAEAELRLGATRYDVAVGALDDDGATVTVRDTDGRAVLRAGWVLDSRPRPPRRPGRTAWLQHFRGWWLESSTPVFDPGRAVLMDFRTPQPARGVSFGYVLPVSDRYALVEYTEFSPAVLSDAGYDAGLRGYAALLGLDLAASDGAGGRGRGDPDDGRAVRPPPVAPGGAAGHRRWGDPPVDRVHLLGDAPAGRAGRGAVAAGRRRCPGRRTRGGTGGWTRWRCGRWNSGVVGGPEFFDRLFDRNPAVRVLRFLDGATSPAGGSGADAVEPAAADDLGGGR